MEKKEKEKEKEKEKLFGNTEMSLWEWIYSTDITQTSPLAGNEPLVIAFVVSEQKVQAVTEPARGQLHEAENNYGLNQLEELGQKRNDSWDN